MATPTPESAVATVRLCDWCKRPLATRNGRFCANRCRAAFWEARHPRMELLPFDPLRQRKPSRSLSETARRVLGRLQAGPATWRDLQEVGGRRFSARIEELRDQGHRIIGPKPLPLRGWLERTEPDGNGDDVYELRP